MVYVLRINEYYIIMFYTSFYTYNVRGIQDDNKRAQVFHYLHKKGPEVVFLQETHSTPKVARYWASQWGGKIYYAHGTSNSRGVAILLKKNVPIEVHNVDLSEEGRYIILYTTFKGHKVALVNVYAPNEDAPNFFRKVFQRIANFQAADFLVITGDMNLAIDPLVDRLGSIANNNLARDRLISELEGLEMVDIWRTLKPDINGYTWRRNNPKSFSRLDYYFITESAMQFIEDIQIVPGFKTDHSIVKLTWNIDEIKRGPGYWKLNTSLLKDVEYIDKVRKLIQVEIAGSNHLPVKTRWEMLKMAVKGTTIQYASFKKRCQNNLEQALEKKLSELESKQERIGPNIFTDTDDQIRRVRHDLEEIYKNKTKGAMIRSRSNWAELGEKPTKYFLKLEKVNAQKKAVCRLRDNNGLMIYEQTKILEEMRKYYEKLYTTKGYVMQGYAQNLNLPKISHDSYMMLEQQIDIEEIKTAIKEMKNNKCPGTDGLPIEFYKIFWEDISDIYYELIVDVLITGEFHTSARRSITTLMEKTGKDPLFLKNWRPLSLLNVDNKILGKVLANRLQSIAPEVIHYTQAGFIRGRQIAENLMKILQVMEHCEKHDKPGLLVACDFMKAFDTCEWEAIYIALAAFGIGENFVKMVKVFFTQPLACVSNNGYWSEWYTPSRATRQGCCLSPIIFDFLVEILGHKIRENLEIKGIMIAGEEIKSGQFADDLWSTLEANQENLNNLLREIDNFAEFSGLTLNAEKTNILRIGSFKDSDATFYTMKRLYWSPGPIKILGIQFITDKEEMIKLNYYDTLHKVRTILNNWAYRNLTLMGKIVVVNSLISSLFVHKFLALPTPPKKFFKEYKSLIVSFLWNEKVPKIAYEKIIQNYRFMGLKLVDLEQKETALKAAWPIKWTEKPDDQINWFFENMPIKSKDLWECNLSPQDVDRIVGLSKYSPNKDILKAWAKVNFQPVIEDWDSILQQRLMGNSLIRIANKPIFLEDFTCNGIHQVLNIVHSNEHRLLTPVEVENIYNFRFDILRYYGLVAALPRLWKLEVRNNRIDSVIDSLPRVEILNRSVPPSKYLYWDLVEKTYPPSNASKTTWQLELGMQFTDEQWWDMFPNFLSMVKPTKLRYFQYRLYTKSLTTNLRRHKWDPEVSPLCTFCANQVETTIHLLYNCPMILPLWERLSTWTNYFLQIDIIFSMDIVFLNNYRGKQKEIINSMIIVMKQYIYACKCKESIPTFGNFVTKLSHWYFVEKDIAYKDNKVDKFHKKWQAMFN